MYAVKGNSVTYHCVVEESGRYETVCGLFVLPVGRNQALSPSVLYLAPEEPMDKTLCEQCEESDDTLYRDPRATLVSRSN